MFPHQILCQTVGEHRPARGSVDHIGSAIVLTQPIVDRAGIEKDEALRVAGVGRF